MSAPVETPPAKRKTRRKSMDTPEVIAQGKNAAANAVFVNPNNAPSREDLDQLRADVKQAASEKEKRPSRRKSMDTPDPIAAARNAAANAIFVNPNNAPSAEDLQQLREDVKRASAPTETPPARRKTRRKSMDTPEVIAQGKNAAANAVFVNPNNAPSKEDLDQLRADVKAAAMNNVDYTIDTKPALNQVHTRREWGVEIGVGATALWIASMRKAETKKGENAAFQDPYAARFVADNGVGEQIERDIARSMAHFFHTAPDNPTMPSPTLKKPFIFNKRIGKGFYNKFKNAEVSSDLLENSLALQRLSVTRRVCHFDNEINNAVEKEGITQLVTLAAGLDMRCLRLKCLQGGEIGSSVVTHYLIDQAPIIAHVKKVVPEVQKPYIKYIDVKFGEEKWWERLTAAGFDKKKPSIFLVEGLMMYLQEEEVEETIRHCSQLMCAGSILTGDYTLRAFMTHVLFTGFMTTLEKWKCRWTYGPRKYEDFHIILRRAGLTVLEDRDLLNSAGPLLTWFRDKFMHWVPNYRCYTAAKGTGESAFKSVSNKSRISSSKIKPD